MQIELGVLKINRLVFEYIKDYDVNSDVKNRAMKVAKRFYEKCIPRHTPRVIGSACLYLASMLEEEPMTQHEIEMETGVTQPALTKAYKKIYESLDLDLQMIPGRGLKEAWE